MKKLYILRHAKSDYPDDINDDHARPLNKKGQKDCKLIGNYLIQHNINLQVILSSDAVRTKETITNILRVSGNRTEVNFSNKLYLATAGEIIKQIGKDAGDAESVMVVAHNPGVWQLAQILTQSGDYDLLKQLATKYPTASMACFSINIDNWQDLQPASAILDRFITPKSLR